MGLRARENKPSFKRKRDNYARKLRKKKLINYLRNELRTCTTHGLPYIVNMEIHWFERFFWAVSFCASFGLTIYLLRMQFLRYANKPVVTSVEMDYFNWNVSFPAITLCPDYKVEDEVILKMLNESLEENIEGYLRVIATLSYDAASDAIDLDSLQVPQSLLTKDYSTLAAMLFKKFDSNSLSTRTNTPIPVDIAMTEMGMCHVINSNFAALDNPLKWNTAKYAKNNLDLSFYDQDFFVQILNYADNYKIYVHGPDEQIQSTSPYYNSKYDGYLEFAVTVWSTKTATPLRSEPISTRQCRYLDEPISERYPVYTYSHCIIECRIKMILKLCGCLPHIYKNFPHERICYLNELSCWTKHKKEIVTLSFSNETLTNLTNTDGLPRSSRDCNCLNNCEGDIFMKDHETTVTQSNFNTVRIVISSYPKVRVVKDTIVNLYDIILRSGGVVNLCLGTSVISLMELIVLFTKIIMVCGTSIASIIVKLFVRIIRRYKIRTKKENNKKQY